MDSCEACNTPPVRGGSLFVVPEIPQTAEGGTGVTSETLLPTLEEISTKLDTLDIIDTNTETLLPTLQEISTKLDAIDANTTIQTELPFADKFETITIGDIYPIPALNFTSFSIEIVQGAVEISTDGGVTYSALMEEAYLVINELGDGNTQLPIFSTNGTVTWGGGNEATIDLSNLRIKAIDDMTELNVYGDYIV